LTPFSPNLELETLFVLDKQRRIVSTREPGPVAGPRFMLIRGTSECAWALRTDVSDSLAAKLHQLVTEEPPTRHFRQEPRHATEYGSLLGGQVESGPAFTFPEAVTPSPDTRTVEDLLPLTHLFRGWTADELPERSPIFAITEGGIPVSICFCARRSDLAAEAGLETAEQFRCRGYGARVAATWAAAIRSSGRLPIYSTSWNNQASLAVARKLHLSLTASHWSLSD